jgi:hypothetical protein
VYKLQHYAQDRSHKVFVSRRQHYAQDYSNEVFVYILQKYAQGHYHEALVGNHTMYPSGVITSWRSGIESDMLDGGLTRKITSEVSSAFEAEAWSLFRFMIS